MRSFRGIFERETRERDSREIRERDSRERFERARDTQREENKNTLSINKTITVRFHAKRNVHYLYLGGVLSVSCMYNKQIHQPSH